MLMTARTPPKGPTTPVQQHAITPTDEPKVMTSIRVAGLVGEENAVELKRIASMMEVAAWIHRVSSSGPTEDWPGPDA